MIDYIPMRRVMPCPLPDVPTAWREVAPVIEDIIERFDITRGACLEFGVDYGYSTAALAYFFSVVHGVDTFMGDVHAGDRGESGIYDQVKDGMAPWSNIHLHRYPYQDWIVFDENNYDLIHIDIVHNYEQTFECGDWSVQHAPVVIFHDTLAFADVMRAVTDLAAKHGLNFYNVNEQHGLGILTKRVPHE